MQFEESKINKSFNEFIRKNKQLLTFKHQGVCIEHELVNSISAINSGILGDFDNGYNWQIIGTCELTNFWEDGTKSIKPTRFYCTIMVKIDNTYNEFVARIKNNEINIE